MTSVRPLTQAGSGVRWAWLASAAQMAGGIYSTPPACGEQAGRACYPRVAVRIPGPDPASVRAARDFARCTLRRWGLADRCDEVVTVISELVTNALRYGMAGGWPIRAGLLQPRPCSGVLCAVADPSPAAPVLQPLDGPAESGRGLHVVQGLSDSWGCAVSALSGKVVWATFETVTRATRD